MITELLKALLKLYYGSITALLRLYYGSITALLRLDICVTGDHGAAAAEGGLRERLEAHAGDA